MVDEQLKRRDITDARVLAAFLKVERHKFVPDELRPSAYADFPLPIGEGQTISQPYIAALMTQCLRLRGKEEVLEIGTGSGYQAAVLAQLCAHVYSIERSELLASKARLCLDQAGYKNISIKSGDGTLGWEEDAPFDRIIITAAASRVPLPLAGQLKEGGIIVAPLGESFSQVLTVLEKKNNQLESTPVCSCIFVPLIGKYSCS